MIEIGKYNDLVVLKSTPIGIYLGDENEEVLLPKRYVPADVALGELLKVFVYLDNENRPVATTKKPYAVVGEFAFLKVKDINEHGAFFDWGIDKDIFVPYSEQTGDPEAGNKYLLYIFIDERSGRIAASMKWDQFIDTGTDEVENSSEVHLMIAKKTEIGYRAIIDNRYEGLLYNNEVFEPLEVGDTRKAFVKLVREDGKIDLTLQQQGYGHIEDAKGILMQALKSNNGLLSLGDKSSPDDIYQQLKISKKAFKKAVGGLYKDRLVSLSDFETRLLVK